MYKFYYHLGQNTHTWFVHTQDNSGKIWEKLESVVPFREGTRTSSPSSLSCVFFSSYHVLILSILNKHNELLQIFCKSPIIRIGRRRMIWKCEHDILWNQQCFKKRYFLSSLNKSSIKMWSHTHTHKNRRTYTKMSTDHSKQWDRGGNITFFCLLVFIFVVS